MLDSRLETQTLLLPNKASAGPGFCRRLAECLCCCCVKPLVSSIQRVRVSWKQRWRKIKAKYSHKKTYQDTVFPVLLKLAADDHTIAELEALNLSPIVSKSEVRRDDLEFYVPQLSNFMLFGEFEEAEKLVKFLLEACRTSFQFAHRVLWFLASTDFSLLETPKIAMERLANAVRIAVRGSHRLYIGRSDELFSLCCKLGLGVFPATLASFSKPSGIRAVEDAERLETQEIIEKYRKMTSTSSPLPAINPQFLFLENSFAEDGDTFMSTINFVKELTEASVKVSSVVDKKEELINILTGINKKLPASVYLPFTKNRNCAVLQLHVSELKVFKTKERAPFLIAMEVFNPYDEYQRYFPPSYDAGEDSTSDRKNRSTSLPLGSSFSASSVFEIKPELEIKAENISEQTFQTIMSEAAENAIRNLAGNQGIHGSYSMLVPSSTSYIVLPDATEELRIFSIQEEEKETEEHIPAPHPESHYENETLKSLAPARPRAQTIMYVYENEVEEESLTQRKGSIDAPDSKPSDVFGESSEEQAARIQERSPYRDLKTWGLVKLIVKSGDDLRQEQLAMQLITQFQEIFKQAELGLWLRPYEIVATGKDCGLIECVDAMSIDSLKKSTPSNISTLDQFFRWHFGPVRTKSHKKAQQNFVRSLAAYSLVCFILQIKDRHNGNILMDRHGHIVHIDFGFMISNAPGGGIKFEQAPFKLTDEFVAVMEGVRSSHFQDFRKLCGRGFIELKRHQQKIWLLLEMSRNGSGASLPCFVGGEAAITDLKTRLEPRENMSEGDCKDYVNQLIDESLDHWTTTCYDRYQRCCQNIL